MSIEATVQLMAARSAIVDEVFTVLQHTFDIQSRLMEVGTALNTAGYDRTETATRLAELLKPEIARAAEMLSRLGYALEEIIEALVDVYELTIAEVAAILAELGIE